MAGRNLGNDCNCWHRTIGPPTPWSPTPKVIDDFTLGDGSTLVIEKGASLTVPSDKKLDITDGALYNNGTLTVGATTSLVQTSGSPELVANSGSTTTVVTDSEGAGVVKFVNNGGTVQTQSSDGTKTAQISTVTESKIKTEAQLRAALESGASNISVEFSDNVTLTKDLDIGNAKVNVTNGAFNLDKYKIIVSGGSLTSWINNTSAKANSIYFGGVSGTYTVAKGSSIDVTAEKISGTIKAYEGTLDLAGNVIGELTVKEYDATKTKAVKFSDPIVLSGAKLTLASGTDLTYSVVAEKYFYVYGSLTADGVTVDVPSKATMKAFAGAGISGVTVSGAGSIDLSQAQNPQTVGEDISYDKTYGQLEYVTVVGSLTIKNNAKVTILGGFELNEGVTLTIQSGSELIINSTAASMIVNGTIIIEEDAALTVSAAKDVEVSGSIVSEGTLTLTGKVTVKSGGSIYVNDATVDSTETEADAYASTFSGSENLTIEAGAELVVKSYIGASTITNKGSVVLDGAVLGGDLAVNMAADDAVVEIDSVTGNSKVTITDLGLKFSNTASVDGTNYIANSVSFTPSAYTIKGLTVTQTVSSYTYESITTYYNGFDLSGAISSTDSDGKAQTRTITLIGSSNYLSGISVSEALALGEKVQLTLSSGNMSVEGTIDATSSNASVTSDGTITVYGLIQTVGSKIDSGINAAVYQTKVGTDTIYNHVTLVDALEAGATDIEMLGSVSVLEDATIPAGTVIKGTGAITVGSSMNSDVIMTVLDGGSVKNASVTVAGTLVFENKKDNRTVVYSDVSVIGDVSSKYTNLYTALNEAESGDTVTITGNKVAVTKSVTIKDGVTLDVPLTKQLVVYAGVVVTVNGVLKTAEEIVGYTDSTAGTTVKFALKASVKENTASIQVAGTFMSMAELTYAKYVIPGAYYTPTDGQGYKYVSNLADASERNAYYVEVFGEVTAGDVSFTGTSTSKKTVAVDDASTLTVTSITLSNAYLDVDGKFSGSVKVGDAAVDAKYVDMYVMIDSYGVLEVVAVDESLLKLYTETASFKVSAGTVRIDLAEMDVTVASGATLAADGTFIGGKLTVEGTVLVDNDKAMEVSDIVTVTGTLTVADATDTKNAGSFDINSKYLFVGITKKNAIGAAANVSGPITDASVAFVAAGSSVSETTLDSYKNSAGDLKSTTYTVEGKEWMTVYDASGAYLIGDVKNPTITDATFGGGWLDSDGADASEKTIGASKATVVTAEIDYEIYVIVVLAEAGIENLAIDGNLMIHGNDATYGNAYFSSNYFKAGSHTVTYTLKNGYSGTAKLALVSATATTSGETIDASVSGMNVTVSGDKGAVVLQLTGIEKSGYVDPVQPVEEKKDGLTVTDYLLIVLVILVVILAVIVALRLMRS